MQLTNLERALLHAAKAFIQAYNQSEQPSQGVGGHEPKRQAPSRSGARSGRCNLVSTDDGNGLKCDKHGTLAAESKKKPGEYYCKTGYMEYMESQKNR